MIKFSVGHQYRRDTSWMRCIITNKEQVNEVFFGSVSVQNGRTGERVTKIDYSDEERASLLSRDLKMLSEAGVPLNILFNAGCYGARARSCKTFDAICREVDRYISSYCLSSVTTTSPFIAEVIKGTFPSLVVRASINMEITSSQGMAYISNIFDGYYLKRELNRDLKAVRRARKWCLENGKQLLMLANSGCLNDCSIRIFHNNLVAHGDELTDVDKRFPLRGCRDYLIRTGDLTPLIRDTNWVRPEDIDLYDGLFDSVKLATRVNRNPEAVLLAYVNRKYEGSILELLEPDHEFVMKGGVLSNRDFPSDFGIRVGQCNRNCANCGYCESVFKRVYRQAGRI